MLYRIDPDRIAEGVFDSNYKFEGITVTAPRVVEGYELEIFTESGGQSFINGNSARIRPGLVICAHPGDLRYTELPTRCHYIKLRRGMPELEALLEPLPRFARIRETERCAVLIRDMLTAGLGGDDLTRMARLLEVIALLRTACTQSAMLAGIAQKKNRAAIEEAIAYMETHFRDGCTLEQVATVAHFSPIYFHRIFREAVGRTPYEYLCRLRLEEAKRLLLTERESMAGIAERCGYSSQSYFNCVFRRETGMTPGEFRRRGIARYCV